MKVFICYEGFCEHFDVPPDQTVAVLKQMVKDNFLVQLSNDNWVRQYLELSYGGAALQDSWALCDVGITRGSAIRCLIKVYIYSETPELAHWSDMAFADSSTYISIDEKVSRQSEHRPVMCVLNTVTGETLPIIGNKCLLHASVAKLRTMVSVQSGFPVSSFRLSTPARVPLYDCNWLRDYSVEMGTILRLDTWDGWVEFLQGCLLGQRLTVQSHLSEEKPVRRFQLRVALYIAACSGHLDLAGWLLDRGVHAEEPVGVHPYRQWCQQTAHQDTRKCPIHVAAESSQLLILKLFTTKNLLSLACRDPGGRDPLKIAIQHGHRDCARYLANKLCSVVSLPNLSLPMRIYLQIKRWVSSGKKRAASSRCQYTTAAIKTRLGNTLLIDGFNHPKRSSKSSKAETKSRRRVKAKDLQPLSPITNLLSASHLPSKRATPLLPSLQSVKEMQKKLEQRMKSTEDGPLDEMKERDNSLCRGKFVLPPVNRENLPGPVCVGASPRSSHILKVPLESSHRCGQTARGNAVHCLTIASTFTEKPWLKQLSIARTLVRKHVRS